MTRTNIRHAPARRRPGGGVALPLTLLVPALGLLGWALWLATTLPGG